MKNSRIVFLDFDGPLFSHRALMLMENNDFAPEMLSKLNLNPLVSYWKADPVAIDMLHHLYRFRAFKIVVLSAWAEIHDKKQIEALLHENGLDITLHTDWRVDFSHLNKPEQIRTWLNKHQIENYLILDDDLSGEDLQNKELLQENNIDENKIVLVSADDGIAYHHYFRMKAIAADWE